jgi:uncharacterized protein (TIGR02145 family)
MEKRFCPYCGSPLENDPCQERQLPHVLINGIKWDRENTVIDGKTHFTFSEALGAAQLAGKRLPTEKELEDLIALGSTWDDKRKGRWIGRDHQLKEKSKESVFFVIAGGRWNGTIHFTDLLGYYWSSTPNGTGNARSLLVHSGTAYVDSNYRANGFSVRCVAE